MNGQYLKKILPVFLLPIFLLTGCWQDTSTSEVLPGDTSAVSSQEQAGQVDLPQKLSLAYFSNATLDPVTCPGGDQQTVAALLYEGLYELDQNLTPQPRLCTGGSYDPASLTWIFPLRSGITFSDGSALTAGDCAATLERARTSDRYRARLSGIQSVSAGNGTVAIVLNSPNTNLPALLDIPIVKSGTEGKLVPIGSGPYFFVSDDTGTYLSANQSWWKGTTQPVSRIELVSCADGDAARYQFTSHSVQLLTTDLTGSNPVSATGSFSFYDADTTTLQYLGINLRNSLLASAAVRNALSLGIDRNTVVSAYLSGHGKAACFPISPALKSYPAALETAYSYDDFASAMQSAGLATGTASHSLTMIVNSENSFRVSVARYLASALSAFDLKITVKELPWEDYLKALQSGTYDLYFGEVRLTADWNLTSLLGTGGSLNYGGFSDATMDLLLSEYSTASDKASAIQTECSYFSKQSPILPICFKCTSVLTQEGVVGNLTPTAANPFYDIGTCTIHLAK